MTLKRFVGETGPVYLDPIAVINASGGSVTGICSTVWTKVGQTLFILGSPDEIYEALKTEAVEVPDDAG